jgi:hypothetical protein
MRRIAYICGLPRSAYWKSLLAQLTPDERIRFAVAFKDFDENQQNSEAEKTVLSLIHLAEERSIVRRQTGENK